MRKASPKKDRYGFIYALSHPDYDFLKIGYTINSPSDRCRQWRKTKRENKPFKLIYSCFTKWPWRTEKTIKQILSAENPYSEYFNVTLEELKLIIKFNFKEVDYFEYQRKLSDEYQVILKKLKMAA